MAGVRAIAGFNGQVRAKEPEGAYSVVESAFDADFSRIMAALESTTFGDEDEARVYGLGDATFSVDCLLDPTDDGQGVIQDALDGRENVVIEYTADGTNGFEAEFMVTSEDPSQSVDDRVVVSFSLELAKGSVTRVSA